MSEERVQIANSSSTNLDAAVSARTSQMVPGTNPLDFVVSNLRQPQTSAVPVPPPPVADAAPAQPTPQQVVAEPVKQPAKQPAQETPEGLPLSVAEPEATPAQEEIPAENAAETLLKKPGKEESFRTLRTKVKAHEEALVAKDNEITRLNEEIEKFRRGDNVPETIVELTNKVASLTGYQKLHAFKTSDEYQQKFVEPLMALDGKIAELAKDYALPKEVLDKAVAIDNKKDLNTYLAQYFDVLGANEARGIIDQVRGLKSQAAEMEKTPEDSHRIVREEYLTRQRIEDEQRVQRLSDNGREGWIGALTDLQKQGRYPEITLRKDDEAHNAYARPILENASKEFANIMKILTAYGMKDLPKDAAQILAKRVLLSEVAAITTNARNTVLQENEQIRNSSRVHTKLNRIPLGTPMNGATINPPATKPAGQGDRLTSAADSLLRQVGVIK